MRESLFALAAVVASTFLAAAACAHGSRDGAAVPPADDAGSTSLIDDDASIHQCAGADSTSSLGCEYWAVHMDGTFDADNGCFVVFVANASSDRRAHVEATFDGAPIDLSQFAKVPRGSGKSITYADFDPSAGVAPGDVALLFLAGPPQPGQPKQWDQGNPVPCPVQPALSSLTQQHGTGIGRAFRIRTDQPVAAYQMLPYGGGSAAVTGATTLAPTSAYGTNYIAAAAYGDDDTLDPRHGPSMDIVAAEDGTTVTILPNAAIKPAPGVAAAPAGQPVEYKLDAGQVLQITQSPDLTGSPIQSDKPIGLFAGYQCLALGGQCCCDHAEQQIPGVQQMGSEYVAAGYRDRTTFKENRLWRLVGAVDGTRLAFDPPVGGPSSIGRGQVVEVHTDTPFVVRSQDSEHPFLMLGYMSSANTLGVAGDAQGYGDPDFVRNVPVPQWRPAYVFFTDPTYPETDLVVVRKRGAGGFSDVKLDCAGTLSGWTAIDASDTYEMTRVDLVRHDFQKQGECDNGRHEAMSDGAFSLTVWGWGTPETSVLTGYVSYGYPAGENLLSINQVVVNPR